MFDTSDSLDVTIVTSHATFIGNFTWAFGVSQLTNVSSHQALTLPTISTILL